MLAAASADGSPGGAVRAAHGASSTAEMASDAAIGPSASRSARRRLTIIGPIA